MTTNGDSLADLIERKGLGLTVPPEDVDALADALFTLLDDKARAEACRENIREIVPELVWAETLRPLVEFCRAPRRAPDLMEGLIGDDHGPHPTELTPGPRGLRADVALVVRYLPRGRPGAARAARSATAPPACSSPDPAQPVTRRCLGSSNRIWRDRKRQAEGQPVKASRSWRAAVVGETAPAATSASRPSTSGDHRRVGAEPVDERVLHLGPHPGHGLAGPVLVGLARGA